MTTKRTKKRATIYAHRNNKGLAVLATLPDRPCGKCGARGWCDHRTEQSL